MKENSVSVIIPFVPIDEEIAVMTRDCVESFEQTKDPEDEIILVEDREMRGNAWAWNEGVRRSKNPIILLSDNDILASDLWKKPMIETLERADVVFPLVLNLKIYEKQSHLAGECFMFRRSTYEKVGGFDEAYGSYFEDTDWFKRVMIEGGKLAVCQEALVSHRSQATFKRIWSDEKIQANFKENQKKYEDKYNGEYPFLG